MAADLIDPEDLDVLREIDTVAWAAQVNVGLEQLSSFHRS